MTLFKRMRATSNFKVKKEFCAIQYQEYDRKTTKDRAISFPKFLIVEQLEKDNTPLTSFLRIYEMKTLDHDISNIDGSDLGFIYLEGEHVNKSGEPITDMAAPQVIEEQIKSIQTITGGSSSLELAQFIDVLAQGYVGKYPGCTRQIFKSPLPAHWQEFSKEGAGIFEA